MKKFRLRDAGLALTLAIIVMLAAALPVFSAAPRTATTIYLNDTFDTNPLTPWYYSGQPATTFTTQCDGYAASLDASTGSPAPSARTNGGSASTCYAGITKTVSLSSWAAGTKLVLALNFRSGVTATGCYNYCYVYYTGASPLANVQLFIFDGPTQLYSTFLYKSATGLDGGWKYASIDITSIATGHASITIYLELVDYYVSNYFKWANPTNRYDNISVSFGSTQIINDTFATDLSGWTYSGHVPLSDACSGKLDWDTGGVSTSGGYAIVGSRATPYLWIGSVGLAPGQTSCHAFAARQVSLANWSGVSSIERQKKLDSLFVDKGYSLVSPNKINANLAIRIANITYTNETQWASVNSTVNGFITNYSQKYGVTKVYYWTAPNGELNFGVLVSTSGVVTLYYITVQIRYILQLSFSYRAQADTNGGAVQLNVIIASGTTVLYSTQVVKPSNVLSNSVYYYTPITSWFSPDLSTQLLGNSTVTVYLGISDDWAVTQNQMNWIRNILLYSGTTYFVNDSFNTFAYPYSGWNFSSSSAAASGFHDVGNPPWGLYASLSATSGTVTWSKNVSLAGWDSSPIYLSTWFYSDYSSFVTLTDSTTGQNLYSATLQRSNGWGSGTFTSPNLACMLKNHPSITVNLRGSASPTAYYVEDYWDNVQLWSLVNQPSVCG